MVIPMYRLSETEGGLKPGKEFRFADPIEDFADEMERVSILDGNLEATTIDA